LGQKTATKKGEQEPKGQSGTLQKTEKEGLLKNPRTTNRRQQVININGPVGPRGIPIARRQEKKKKKKNDKKATRNRAGGT